jgi:hypothetical protein
VTFGVLTRTGTDRTKGFLYNPRRFNLDGLDQDTTAWDLRALPKLLRQNLVQTASALSMAAVNCSSGAFVTGMS